MGIFPLIVYFKLKSRNFSVNILNVFVGFLYYLPGVSKQCVPFTCVPSLRYIYYFKYNIFCKITVGLCKYFSLEQ